MSNKLLVGRYELIEKIGEGGMAVVYKSKDRLLNRYVAIKILRPEYTKDAQFVDSFRRESQAAAGLQHPNIVSVYDVGHEGNIHYIVMELVDGKPLSTIINEQAPLNYKTCIEIIKQVASALSLAHKNNIIHRDIKPHNIMLTQDGVAKLGDFGIAKAVSDSTLTETSKIIGSVHYFSPEQARGAYVDERSDIYSLGIVLYEMLTGDVPFDGENPVQVALMHINDEIRPPSMLVSGIPPVLEKVVMKATDKYQANRYASADEFLEALKNVEFATHMVGDSIFAGEDINAFREENRRKSQMQRQHQQYMDYDDYEDETPRKKSSSKGKGKKKKKILIGVIILLLILGAVGAALALNGNKKIEVPDVTNFSYAEAKAELQDAGFKVKKGDNVASDDIEEGKVAQQDPEGGTKAEKGTVVTVNISDGPANDAVPNLVGRYYDRDSITQYLNSLGFELGGVTEEKSDKYEKNQIIRQDPTGNATAKKGTAISIVVCSGKKTNPEDEKVSVPSLTGLSFEEAKAKLTSYGLKAGAVVYEESTVYSKGTVMWQQYDSGEKLKKNSPVNLKVSKGAPSTPETPKKDTTKDDDDSGNTDNGSTTQEDED